MNEYLLGSRKLKAFPVAMSLVARYVQTEKILSINSSKLVEQTRLHMMKKLCTEVLMYYYFRLHNVEVL